MARGGLQRLADDHRRWLRAARRLEEETAQGSAPAQAAARFLALWESDVLPRWRWEEEVLVPELAGRVGEADALVVFALGDHCAMRRLARELRDSPEAGIELARRLAEHVAFEERTLFPALEATLGAARVAELLQERPRGGGPGGNRGAE